MKAWHYMIIGAGAIIALFLSFRLGQEYPHKSPVEPLKEKVDTLFIRDSSTFTEPKEKPSPRIITKEIPMPVYLADSTAIDSLLNECARLEKRGDSLQLILLREQKHYSDSTFDAWVSGIDPRLDSIKTYQNDMVITKEVAVPVKVHSRWGLGVSAGYGAALNGNAVSLSPYIGVGLHYNILSW